MKPLTIGSICSGTGMLDEAVMQVIDARPAWFCQYEPPGKDGKEDRWQFAARVLTHHWPEVPNHGDITQIDWTSVNKVDWITAGFPCQDVSLAGKREGLAAGTRSGIWRNVAAAIAAQRAMRASGEPGPIVYLENVRGLLSARADSNVEPCPECLGDGTTQPALRALGAVLGDLADLGFDAEWVGLPASHPHVEACHERWREFILAWPAADASSLGRGEGRPRAEGFVGGSDAAVGGHAAPADTTDNGLARDRGARDRRNGSADGDHPAADAERRGRDRRPRDEKREPVGRTAAARTRQGSGGGDVVADPDSDTVRQQPVAQPGCDGQAQPRLDQQVVADPDNAQWSGQQGEQPRRPAPAGGGGGHIDWGPYGPAIRRWEAASGQRAPRPTQPGRSGRDQLAPVFSEWMMGLPEGHVTGVPRPEGMSLPGYRNAQLKVIGGGVVPQQGAYALRMLLHRAQDEAAS
ncbi:DNA cytosine methyltransferase [Nonomuraea zeae]|uniref:DNA cytosine methyltransferase n=1 Tax=Nonomuraea zeae TaxID=1642303 RepID=UPI00197E5C27|nr:DNA cytosine methyltransferase [Nonomuraea zeae]